MLILRNYPSVLFVFLLMSATSCTRKKYNCVCQNPGGAYLALTVKGTLQQAQDVCNSYYQDNFGTIPMNETTCSIQ
jgi:hypothetical protein